jgi:hypothetical protein
MPDLQQIQIPGRCAACGNEHAAALTLRTRRKQGPWHDDGRGGLILWQADDGDLVTCPCGARYVCRDLGDGRIEVVKEVPNA